MTDKEVIILAGGFGTRLREVVGDLPKSLAPINDKPFLYYLISYLQKYGVNRFIFSLGYKHDLIVTYIREFHSEIEAIFVVEDSPLGTGGAIKEALKISKSANILVVNGDTYFDFNLNDFYEKAILGQFPFTIALLKIENNYRYGFVELDEKNEIIRFCEKQESNNVFINTGFYIINKEQLDFGANNDIFSLEKDFFESDLRKIKLYGIEFNDEFIDIGVPYDFNKAQTFFKQLNINN